MQGKINYALVGLFVIALGAALLGAVFWLTLSGETKTYDRYRVYFKESVAGLNPRATVRYRGVQVGQVVSIRLNPDNPDQVDVVLDVERGTPIRRDTIATLSTRGLTGVASVELSGGGQTFPLEKDPGQDLPVIKAGPSLVARLDDAFNNILTNINDLSGRLARLLGDDNQIALSQTLQHLSAITGVVAERSTSIRQTLIHMETLSETLAGRAERLGKALDRMAGELEKTGGLGSQVRDTLGDVRASAQAVRSAADRFSQTSLAFIGLAGDSHQVVQRLGQTTLPELGALLVQASELMAALQRLAGTLEQNPRALLIGKPQGRPGPGEE